ncbi:MAG TPA: AMP-binding protein, partial [Euzebya sp.]|nr:AMP-binding protein [Euzebya sp.]
AIDRGWGDRPCMADATDSWTYGQVLEWANRLAGVLVQQGVVPGNRVLLRGSNAAWLVAAWFATLKVGGVVVVTMPMLRESELRPIAEKCQPTVALCDAASADALVAMAGDMPVLIWGGDGDLIARAQQQPTSFANVDTAADDPALLGFTSGTTGTPKAAIHFHRDLIVIAETFQPVLKATAEDIFCGSPPLAFTFGLGGLVVFPMWVGASTVFSPGPGPGPLVDLIEQRGATVCITAPTAYRKILELAEGRDLSTLRRGVSAGETLPERTFLDFEQATGIRLIDGLGATEMLHIFIASADDEIRPGATGKPLMAYEARVIDDDGQPVADGTIGRLAVRGPIGCRYLDDPRQTDYVQEGWNIPGDAYVRDGDGYFHYQARTDDMIISSGYNIAAPDVEHALLTHPAVAEAGVIGVPDEDRGMLVKAFVHLRDPAAASDALRTELQDHVKATIAPYKYPRLLEWSVDPLPRTGTGKLQRFALRDRG